MNTSQEFEHTCWKQGFRYGFTLSVLLYIETVCKSCIPQNRLCAFQGVFYFIFLLKNDGLPS